MALLDEQNVLSSAHECNAPFGQRSDDFLGNLSITGLNASPLNGIAVLIDNQGDLRNPEDRFAVSNEGQPLWKGAYASYLQSQSSCEQAINNVDWLTGQGGQNDSRPIKNSVFETIASSGATKDASQAELYVVNGDDSHLDDLVARLRSQGARVLQLQGHEGLVELVQALDAQLQPGALKSLHFVSHGAPDRLAIGSTMLSSQNVREYQSLLKELGTRLQPEGDVLLWGCEIAETAAGQQLVQRLADLTGAVVAASSDLTFAEASSGRSDWDLEFWSGARNDGYQDLLTGLGWSGSLGGDVSYANGTLTISKASDTFSMSGTLDAANKGEVILSGSINKTLQVEGLKKIKISGSRYTIQGLDLDKPGDNLAPAAYDIDLGSDDLSNDITLIGTVKSHGGNLRIGQQNESRSYPFQTLVDWLNGGLNKISTIKLGLESTSLDLDLKGGGLDISQDISIKDWFDLWSQDAFFLNSAEAILSDMAASIKGLIVPLEVKVQNVDTSVSFVKANINAATVKVSGKSSLALTSKSSVVNSQSLSSRILGGIMDLALSVVNGKANTKISTIGSTIKTSGDVSFSTTSTSNLSASAQVASNTSPKGLFPSELTNPSGSKSGVAIGIAYGAIDSAIYIDTYSSITAGGNVMMEAISKPNGSANAKTNIYVDGKFAVMGAFNIDNANATITIDGKLTSGNATTTSSAALLKSATSPAAAYIPKQDLTVSVDGKIINAQGKEITPDPTRKGIQLANGQLIQFGQNTPNNLFTFLGSDGSWVDLRTINPIADTRFAQSPAWTFSLNPDLKVGDMVQAIGLNSAATYDVITKSNGQQVLVKVGSTQSTLLPTPTRISPIDLNGNSSSPPAESASNAFDGNPDTKYLNFGKEKAGLEIVYTVPTRVTDFTLTTANDCAERDPMKYDLEGYGVDGKWAPIIQGGALNLSQTRKTRSELIKTGNQAYFSKYRIVFTALRDSTKANSVQIADLSLYGIIQQQTEVARIDSQADGSGMFVDLLSLKNGFLFQNGDVVRWSDGRFYQFLSENNQPQSIVTYSGLPFNSLQGWNQQSFLSDKQSLQITAILKDPNRPDVANYVLAEDQPIAISAAGTTGSKHLLYGSGSLMFDGSSSDAIDLNASEIIIPEDQLDVYNGFNQGQKITYTVQKDAKSKQDITIAGLVAGDSYYLIKRGIDAQNRGRVALAANPNDVLANKWIKLSGLGLGGIHLLSGEVGRTADLTLNPEAAGRPTASTPEAVAQITSLKLQGIYGNGDTIKLAFKNSASDSSTQVVSYTFQDLSGTQDQIQQQAAQQLIEKLNSSQLIGGSNPFLTASVDSSAANNLVLKALNKGVSFDVSASVSNASIAQISQLQLLGTFKADDQIHFNIVNGDGSESTAFAYTTVSADISQIAAEMAQFLQSQPFAAGAKSYLSVSVDPTNPTCLRFMADSPGMGFQISQVKVITKDSQLGTGQVQVVDLQANVTDMATDPKLTLTNQVEAVTSPNYLGPVFSVSAIDGQNASAPPDSLVSNQIAVVKQGLFKNKDGSFLGANYYFASNNEIYTNTGKSSAISIRKNETIYVESTDGQSGRYWTYTGDQNLQIHSLSRRQLPTEKSTSNWKLSYGPSVSIARTLDTRNRTMIQLLGVSNGEWSLKDSAVTGKAPVIIEVGVPLLSFNPTAAGTVDAVNNTLYLPGLNAYNGQVFSYYSDPNFSTIAKVTAIASGTGDGVQTGTNRWNGVQLPTSLADGSLVPALFLTGMDVSSGSTSSANKNVSPASMAGISSQKTVYLRQVKDSSGNPVGVDVFSDAAGTQRLLLSSPQEPSSKGYFAVQVSQSQGSVSIQGLTPGEQIQLHALGHDLYQVAVNSSQFLKSQPYAARGQQITASTQLTKLNNLGTTGNLNGVSSDSLPGISLTTSIEAKVKAKASGGTGSSPLLRDYASNPWLLANLGGFKTIPSAFLATMFKDAIKDKDSGNYLPGKDDGAISGSGSVNIINHSSKVTLGKSSLLTSSGLVNIGTSTKTSLACWADAATNQDLNKLGVLTAAIAFNKINNTAESDLQGVIQPASEGPKPELRITNTVAYPSLSGLESLKDIGKDLSTLVGAISGFSGYLMQNSINSYATVKNRGKDIDADNGAWKAGTKFAIAGAIEYSVVKNTARTLLSGTIKARSLTHASNVASNLVLGAGTLHLDFGLDRLLSGFIGSKSKGSQTWLGRNFGQSKLYKDGWSAAFKELIDWGNVGAYGFGASIQVLDSSNIATLDIAQFSQIELADFLKAINNQGSSSLLDNQGDTTKSSNVVSIAVGGGRSEALGLSGSASITLGEGNRTGTTVKKGAKVTAKSATINANDNTNQYDCVGGIQYSSAIGFGASLILNKAKRDTRNVLESLIQLTPAAAQDSPSSDDNLSLTAINEGSNLAVAVAGSWAAQQAANKKQTFSFLGFDKLLDGQLQLSGAGSVSLQSFETIAANSIGDQQSGSNVERIGSSASSYRINSQALDKTVVRNISTAVAWSSGQQQSSKAAVALSGAVAINRVSRNVSNSMQSIDFADAKLSYKSEASTASSQNLSIAADLSGTSGSNSTSFVFSGSYATNRSLDGALDRVTSTVSNLKSKNLVALKLDALNDTQSTAVAGAAALGLQATQQGSIGVSVAINQLSTETKSLISNSDLATSVAADVALNAQSSLSLEAWAVSGQLSASTSGRLALQGGASCAKNSLVSAVSTGIENSRLQLMRSITNSPKSILNLTSTSLEQLKAIAGEIQLYLNTGGQGKGALSCGAAVALNELTGSLNATIDENSVIQADSISLTTCDGASSGAWAVAGAVSIAPVGMKFSASLVGSWAQNIINRPVSATIGRVAASPTGSGTITSGTLSLKAQRSDQSRLNAVAGSADVSVNSSFKIGISGAVALNSLQGGIRAGIYNIKDLDITGDATIIASSKVSNSDQPFNLRAIAGGLDVGLAISPQSASGSCDIGIGLYSAKNTLNDSLYTHIKGIDGGSDSTVTIGGNLTLESNNSRSLQALTRGGSFSLTVAPSYSIGFAFEWFDALNKAEYDVESNLDGGMKTLKVGGLLSITANDAIYATAFNYGVSVGFTAGGEAAVSFNALGTRASNEQTTNVKAGLSNLSSNSSVNQLSIASVRDHQAGKSSSFDASVYSVAISAELAAGGGAIAAGGAYAVNKSCGDTLVTISDVNLNSSNKISATATNRQTASSKGLGVYASVNIGEGAALSASGFIVSNFLGVYDLEADKRSKISVNVRNSTLRTISDGGVIYISTANNASYSSSITGVSVTVSGNAALSGLGTRNSSRIAYDISTSVYASNLLSSGNLDISSNNTSKVSEAKIRGFSVAAVYTTVGVPLSFEASLNKNILNSLTTVLVQDSESQTSSPRNRYKLQSARDLKIRSNDTNSKILNCEATSVSVAAGGPSVSLSGGYAIINNTIANQTKTKVSGLIDISTQNSSPSGVLEISSNEKQTELNGEILATDVSVGGLALSGSYGEIRNILATQVETSIGSKTNPNDQPILSSSGNVLIQSLSDQSIKKTKVRSYQVNAPISGVGVNVTVNSAVAENTSTTAAKFLSGSIYARNGSVTIQAKATHQLLAYNQFLPVSIGVEYGNVASRVTLGSVGSEPQVAAVVGDNVQVYSRDFKLYTSSKDDLLSEVKVEAYNFGVRGGSFTSTAESYLKAESSIGKNSLIFASDSISVESLLDQTSNRQEDGRCQGGLNSRILCKDVSLANAGKLNNIAKINSRATTEILDKAFINSKKILITSLNKIEKDSSKASWHSDSSSLDTGSVLESASLGSLSFFKSTTFIGTESSHFGSFISIAPGAIIWSEGGSVSDPSTLEIRAQNIINVSDRLSMVMKNLVSYSDASSIVESHSSSGISLACAQVVNQSGDVTISSTTTSNLNAYTYVDGYNFTVTNALASVKNYRNLSIRLRGKTTVAGQNVYLYADDSADPGSGCKTSATSISAPRILKIDNLVSRAVEQSSFAIDAGGALVSDTFIYSRGLGGKNVISSDYNNHTIEATARKQGMWGRDDDATTQYEKIISNVYPSVFPDSVAPASTATVTTIVDNFGPIQGNLDSGATTDDTTLKLSGTISSGLAEDESVLVYDDNVFLGIATVNGGTWSFSDPRTLTVGQNLRYSARVSDRAGNQSLRGVDYLVKIVQLSAPALALAADTGTSSVDRITNKNILNVSGLYAGASWEYSLDSGKSWNVGSGNSFAVVDGIYGSGQVQVRQTVEGTLSVANVSFAGFTIITAAPSPPKHTLQEAKSNTWYKTPKKVSVTEVTSSNVLEYSTDFGKTWRKASSPSFVITRSGIYAAGQVQVRQTDIAGNKSQPTSLQRFIVTDDWWEWLTWR